MIEQAELLILCNGLVVVGDNKALSPYLSKPCLAKALFFFLTKETLSTSASNIVEHLMFNLLFPSSQRDPWLKFLVQAQQRTAIAANKSHCLRTPSNGIRAPHASASKQDPSSFHRCESW